MTEENVLIPADAEAAAETVSEQLRETPVGEELQTAVEDAQAVAGEVTAEAAEKYGLTKSNICVIVKTNNTTKVKVGVQNLIVKEELDRIMANRLAQFGAYRLQ